jgi:hypothetical protein
MYTALLLSPLVKTSVILDEQKFKNREAINSLINKSAIPVKDQMEVHFPTALLPIVCAF